MTMIKGTNLEKGTGEVYSGHGLMKSLEAERVIAPVEYDGEILDGRYEFVEILADGRENGQGIVAKARRLSDDTSVVVKQYSEAQSSKDWDNMEQAEIGAAREISFLRRANRDNVPNVPLLLEYGLTGKFIKQPVAVFAYIHGRSLQDIVADADYDPSLEFVRRIAEEMVEPLNYAHNSNAREVVHREVNTKNIMVNGEGSCLIDWATAKSTSGKTRFGTQFVTLNYTAPEVIEGKSFDRRADQYSLGKVLQCMLLGDDVFEAADGNPSPRDFENLNIPKETVRVLEKATARDPLDRYRTIKEFYSAFSGSLGRLEEKIQDEAPSPEPEETTSLTRQGKGDSMLYRVTGEGDDYIEINGTRFEKKDTVVETANSISETVLGHPSGRKRLSEDYKIEVANIIYDVLQCFARDNPLIADALEGSKQSLENAVMGSTWRELKKANHDIKIHPHSEGVGGTYYLTKKELKEEHRKRIEELTPIFGINVYGLKTGSINVEVFKSIMESPEDALTTLLNERIPGPKKAPGLWIGTGIGLTGAMLAPFPFGLLFSPVALAGIETQEQLFRRIYRRELLKQARELDDWIHQARVSQGLEEKVEEVSLSDEEAKYIERKAKRIERVTLGLSAAVGAVAGGLFLQFPEYPRDGIGVGLSIGGLAGLTIGNCADKITQKILTKRALREKRSKKLENEQNIQKRDPIRFADVDEPIPMKSGKSERPEFRNPSRCVSEASFLNRRRMKRDMRRVLKEKGFKREFWKFPWSEVYGKNKIVVKLVSESDSSSKRAGAEIFGRGDDPEFTEVGVPLLALSQKYSHPDCWPKGSF